MAAALAEAKKKKLWLHHRGEAKQNETKLTGATDPLTADSKLPRPVALLSNDSLMFLKSAHKWWRGLE